MKPYQIFYFFLSVFISLLLLAIIFPKEGIPVTGNLILKFRNLDQILDEKEAHYADIEGLLKDHEVYERSDVPRDDSEIEPFLNKGTEAKEVPSKKIPHCPIEFSPDNIRLLYPVFEDLHSLAVNKNLIRILHYGDSQIETDRITGFLRDRIQNMFGGSGCGMISPGPYNIGSNSFIQKCSKDLKRQIGYDNSGNALINRKSGAMFSFAVSENLRKSNLASESSWLSFSPSRAGFKRSKIFNSLSIYLTNTQNTLTLKLFVNDTLFDVQMLDPGPGLSEINWQFNSVPEKLFIRIDGQHMPVLYGISFDSTRGVAVDNIPLRGSSGLVFSKTDTAFLLDMYKKLNVRMIILQFGGNIVPMDADDYSFYESYFRRELNTIKKMLPFVPVIVIGPSDMSVKKGDRYFSYPSVTKVRDAIKNATLSSGYAFWDMFEAMGGENSMPSWVSAQPPLAVPDFVHFTPKGARLVAEMFYEAFIFEYNRWRETEKQNIENK